MNGEVVAWRNRVGDRWHYCERDPREVHDNGKQTDALVLATDYAALQAERDEIEAMNQQQALRLMAQESARIAAEAKLDAVTKDAEALRSLLPEARDLAVSHLGLLTIDNMTDGVEQTRSLIDRIAALNDQGRAGEGES